MLLEYAAELKGLTQLSIVRGVKAAQHLPRELGEAVRRVRSQAVRIVQALRAEIAEITSGRRAAAGQMKRIRNAHGHLQAATELLNQAEVQTVTAAKRRRQSSAHRPPPPPTPPQAPALAAPQGEKSTAVSNLAAFLANMVAMDQVPAPTAAAPAAAAAAPLVGSGAADASAPGGKNLLALQEQIQMLKQQMETMARLQSLMPAAAAAVAANISSGTSAAVASSGPAIPLAPSMGSAAPRSTAPVPTAPALTPDSLFFAGKNSAAVAVAPSAVPQAPVLAPGGPAAPTAASTSTPLSARSAMLGEITARANNAQTGKRVSGGGKNGFSSAPGKKRLSQRSQSTIDTGSAAKNAAASAAAAAATTTPSLKVYVRNVPCSSGSLTECIKVGAAVPLRRTEIARSPGGTPIRDGRPSSNSTQDVLHAAIQARFRNANGGLDVVKQRSQSLMMGRGAHAALALAANRRDSGEVDKENWETS